MEKLLEKGLENVSAEAPSVTKSVKGLEERAGEAVAVASSSKSKKQSKAVPTQASLVTFSRQKLALLQSKYDPKRCSGCDKVCANLQRCVKCKTAYYCSRECQAGDWYKRHKSHCKEIRRLTENVEGRVTEQNKWYLLQELRYHPKMCLWNDIQIVQANMGGQDIITMASYNKEGVHLRSMRFCMYSIIRGPVICKMETGKYIVLTINDDFDDELPDRIEMYTLDFKLHYTYTGKKYGCFGALAYFDGKLLVCDDTKKIIQFDASRLPLTPCDEPIPTGLSDERIIHGICPTVIKSTKALILICEDDLGCHALKCINYSGEKLWELGGHRGVLDREIGLRAPFYPMDVCVDDRGNIFVADTSSNCVVVIKEDLKAKTIYQWCKYVFCVKWCEVNKKLYIVRIDETQQCLETVVLDVSQMDL